MSSSADNTPVKLCLRLHVDRDADLISWLATLDDLPFGGKGEAIKVALRRSIGAADPSPAVDISDLLVQMRTVVEAAVASALANAQVVMRPLAAEAPTPETDAMLDALAENLTL